MQDGASPRLQILICSGAAPRIAPAQAEAQAFSAQNQSTPAVADVATVSGTVLDTNGDAIQGARVQLSEAGPPGTQREMKSGSTGQFAFSNLEPGTYIVTVSGDGMTTFAMALDRTNRRLYLPTAEFEPATSGRPKAKPGTFMILVVDRQ